MSAPVITREPTTQRQPVIGLSDTDIESTFRGDKMVGPGTDEDHFSTMSSFEQDAAVRRFPAADSDQVLLFLNLVGGEEVQSRSSRLFQNLNPARPNAPLGQFPASTPVDAHEAVEAAFAALPRWSRMTLRQRADVLLMLMQQTAGQRKQLTQVITRETGKMPQEAEAEIDRSVEVLHHHLALSWLSPGFGRDGQSEPGHLVNVRREPLGVVVVTGSWQYPLLSLVRSIVPALLWGNCVVMKPAQDAPHTGALLGLVGLHAGLPKGALNVVHGLDGSIEGFLCTEQNVAALVHGGAPLQGRSLASTAARYGKPFHMVEVRRSAMIVLAGANVQEAARAAVISGYALGGRDPQGISHIIVESPVREEFTQALVAEVKCLKAGPPDVPTSTFGPQISSAARDQANAVVERLVQEGAESLVKRHLPDPLEQHPYFVPPGVFRLASEATSFFAEESPGPTLVVQEGTGYKHIVSLAQHHPSPRAFIYAGNIMEATTLGEELPARFVAINEPAHMFRSPSHHHLHSVGDNLWMSGLRERDFFTRPRTVMVHT